MGLFRTDIEVAHPTDPVFHRVNPVVDTGAAYSILPASLLERLGVSPFEGEEKWFTLADGSKRMYSMGEARFRVPRVRFQKWERTTPVIFGPEDVYLLGAVSLQSFGLIADTTHHRLIPNPELYLVGMP